MTDAGKNLFNPALSSNAARMRAARASRPLSPTDLDAIFLLGCGHMLDGYSDSAPGRAWEKNPGQGTLYCVSCRRYVAISEVLFL